MITGTKEYLDDIAKHYVCKDDGGRVVVAWYGIPPNFKGIIKGLDREPTDQEYAAGGFYVISCQHDHFPEEVTRQPSLTERYKRGEELPEPVKSNVKKAMEKRAAMLPRAPHAVTVGGIPAADLGTGELLKYEVLTALVDYAYKYRLDPARGHVCLMYGKPYITIDGYLYHAYKSGTPYKLSSSPVLEAERGGYQIPEGAHAWLARVFLPATEAEYSGLGVVTKEEMTATSKKDSNQLRSPVVAAHPWQLAQKRAEWQALRRAFPIGENQEVDNETGTDKH